MNITTNLQWLIFCTICKKKAIHLWMMWTKKTYSHFSLTMEKKYTE